MLFVELRSLFGSAASSCEQDEQDDVKKIDIGEPAVAGQRCSVSVTHTILTVMATFAAVPLANRARSMVLASTRLNVAS